ncbi:MAG: T9SS type A sorting domain-containing protein [Flavipsychrobacter sp.]|nr:T9SS type A sorting domain-containing protein [Flavipsychrobacter sp.]
MKKTLILSLLISGAYALNAQPLFLAAHNKKNTAHTHFVQAMLARNPQSAPAQKTTGTMERLTGEEDTYVTTNTFASNPITTYSYNSTNTKGSSFNNATGYFSGISYDPYGYDTYGNVNGAYAPQPCNVFADTVKNFNNDGSGIFLLGEQYVTYNGNNITNITSISGSNTTITAASYNGQNKIVSLVVYSILNGVSDTSTKRIFVYAQNKLVADSTYINSPLTVQFVNTYTYDGSGNLTQINAYEYSNSTTIASRKYTNTYTTSNQLKTSKEDDMDFSNNQWYTASIDSFGYTSGIDFYTFEKYTVFENGVSQVNTLQFHLSATGLVDSAIGSVDTGNTVNQTPLKYIVQYDSYNNPVITKGYYGTGTTFSTFPYYVASYTYETYNGTAVPNTTAASAITVYPNPANNIVCISGINATAGNTTIHIVNTMGQLLVTQTADSKTVQTIDINRFSPGAYLLIITDDSGKILQSQKIIKQ